MEQNDLLGAIGQLRNKILKRQLIIYMNIKSLLFFLLLAQFNVQAQDFNINDKSKIELNYTKTLWLNSENASGLATSDLQRFNIVELGYSRVAGSYHPIQEGDIINTFSFNTEGCTKIRNKINLWGKFGYDNISDKNNRFNTLLYNPFDERLVYYVADDVISSWKRQNYDMSFKIGTPIFEDKLFAGIKLDYGNKIASKQNDPRSESYRNNIAIMPGLIWRIGNNYLGFNLYYSYILERSVPTLSNTSSNPKVYIQRGLGNYLTETVGSGGLKTMYYTGNHFGGKLQYVYVKYKFKLLLEGGLKHHTTKVRQSANQPKMMGSTSMLEPEGLLQLYVTGNGKLHKLRLVTNGKFINGKEYSSVWNTKDGTWNIVSSAIMSKYANFFVGSEYALYLLERNSYSWKFYCNLNFKSRKDRYLLPYSVFRYNNLDYSFGIKNNLYSRKSVFSTEIIYGRGYNLSKEYNFNPITPDMTKIEGMYHYDLGILTSNYKKLEINFDWCFYIKKTTGLDFYFSFRPVFTKDHKVRNYLNSGISFIF